MTTFECSAGHQFPRPRFGYENQELCYYCPTCGTQEIRVTSLGGATSPVDDCEGACTL